MFLGLNLKILNMSCNTLHDSVFLTLLIPFHFLCSSHSKPSFLASLNVLHFLWPLGSFTNSVSLVSAINDDSTEITVRIKWDDFVNFVNWNLSATVRWKIRANCNTRSRLPIILCLSGVLILQGAHIKTSKSPLIFLFPSFLSSFLLFVFLPFLPSFLFFSLVFLLSIPLSKYLSNLSTSLALHCYFLISQVDSCTVS